jgi:hypothetical protein
MSLEDKIFEYDSDGWDINVDEGNSLDKIG